MAGQLLIEYLERRKATYTRQSHRKAFTAVQIAQYSDICHQEFAKVVMIKVDGELAMVVLPADHHLKLSLIRDALGVDEVRLATEKEFACRFPRCELGAMPPFGHLYGLHTYMLPLFKPGTEIAFNAGSHSELIRMPLNEYIRLASVTPVSLGMSVTPFRSMQSEYSALGMMAAWE